MAHIGEINMLNQSLQQKMQQKLSPLQIQIMKLLEVPTAQLEQRIKEEVEVNPVLEVDTDDIQRGEDGEPAEPFDNSDTPTEDERERDATMEEYLGSDDDMPSYKTQSNNYSSDDEREDIPFSDGTSFYEHLDEQVGLQNLNESQQEIAKYIIGNIDEDGYLRRKVDEIADDISFATNKDIETKDVAEVLEVVQQFDPPGVGAQDLRECLMLQLLLKGASKDETDIETSPDPIIQLAYNVLDICFEEFSKKHYDKIIKRLHIDDEDDLRDAVEEIVHLNPKPGSGYSGAGAVVKTAQHIIPDFIIDYEDGMLSFKLNSRNDPQLKISATYTEMLEEYSKNKDNQTREQKEAAIFVKQKLDSAKWFIDAIKQRRNTLQTVMGAIMDYQGDYFIDGDESKLKPMILKDIAERTNLDASTISRVSNSKYVQTPFGIYPLKYFFSEKVQSTDGDEVSSREVKKILEESISAEDKKSPLTDDKLAEILAAKSFNIARRTVAKYREQLGIPVARLRKEL